jgi:hypothetical protein
MDPNASSIHRLRKELSMNRALLAAILGSLLLFTGACKSKTENKDAIRDGIMKHIAAMQGLNVNNMTVTVTQATVNGDKAQADVDIRAKNADPKVPAMQVSYNLEKHGNEWVVIKGLPTGGMQHPAPGEMPPPGSMPGVSGPGGQMPANHPDFNSILKTSQPPAQQPPAQQPPAQQPPAQQPSGSYSKP